MARGDRLGHAQKGQLGGDRRPRPVRRVHGGLDATGPGGGPRRQAFTGRPHQRRLADPRFATDHDHAPTPPNVGRSGRQPVELRSPPDERGRRCRHRVGDRRAPQQRRVVIKDGVLKAHQLRSRVDTDLVAQHGAGGLDRTQGVDRPARAVQRQGQLASAPLAERLRRHGVGQHGDELGGLATGQADIRRQLLQLRGALLETSRSRDKGRRVGQPAERPPPPQRPRRLHVADRIEQPPIAGEGGSTLDQPVEAVDVDVVGVDLGDIAPVAPRQGHTVTQRGTQIGDVAPHRGLRPVRRVVAPNDVHDAVEGHDQPGLEQQHRQHRSLLRPTQLGAASHPDAAEQREADIVPAGNSRVVPATGGGPIDQPGTSRGPRTSPRPSRTPACSLPAGISRTMCLQWAASA